MLGGYLQQDSLFLLLAMSKLSPPAMPPQDDTTRGPPRFGPPRPNAIVTLLETEDDLAGVQTLLYSIKVRVKGPRVPTLGRA